MLVNPGTYLSEKWCKERKKRLGNDWEDNAQYDEEFSNLKNWYRSRYEADPRLTRGLTKASTKAIAKSMVNMVSVY
jgi:hypothetical protein